MFHKMPFILLAAIIALVLCDGMLPSQLKSILYALSLTIKSGIIFILPVVIFMLLFKTIAQLASNATALILMIIIGVCCSNFLSTMISYQVGSAIYQIDLSISAPQGLEGLTPAWNFTLPKLIANDRAMFAGLILGLFFSRFMPKLAGKFSNYFEIGVDFILRLFLIFIPFFILGFVVKLIHDKVMESIVHDYALIFCLVAVAQFTYIAGLYFFANSFRWKAFLSSIQNMLPAVIAGFGSMSSAAAMPLTLIGAERNTGHSKLTRLCIPATVNIHLIGDCFAIPIFAFAVMKNFGVAEPTFYAYFIFACYFVLAKFSVAAIPGGGIIVMLPILESHLGFTSEMSSLITALYILFDPVITSANVAGNGGFAMILNKIQGLFTKRIPEGEPVLVTGE